MPDENCRIARLEADMLTMKEHYHDHCKAEKEQFERIMDILQEVRDKQVKMIGFWSGVTFVVTALASVGAAVFNKVVGQ